MPRYRTRQVTLTTPLATAGTSGAVLRSYQVQLWLQVPPTWVVGQVLTFPQTPEQPWTLEAIGQVAPIPVLQQWLREIRTLKQTGRQQKRKGTLAVDQAIRVDALAARLPPAVEAPRPPERRDRLTAGQVKAMRERFAQGPPGYGERAALATLYGVSAPTIYAALRGLTWKQAGGPLYRPGPRPTASPRDPLAGAPQAVVDVEPC